MRGFSSIFWTAGAAAAVLSCYLVSLGVASSRADLERVESEIAMAMRDIRTLETEIGTRGRLSQLERWNENFLRLSAPEADQFAGSAYMVAAMARPEPTPALDSPVIYASAPRYEMEDEAETAKPRLIAAAYEKNENAGRVEAPTARKQASTEGAGPKATSSEPAHPRAQDPATSNLPPPPPRPKYETAPKAAASDPLAPLPTAGAR